MSDEKKQKLGAQVGEQQEADQKPAFFKLLAEKIKSLFVFIKKAIYNPDQDAVSEPLQSKPKARAVSQDNDLLASDNLTDKSLEKAREYALSRHDADAILKQYKANNSDREAIERKAKELDLRVALNEALNDPDKLNPQAFDALLVEANKLPDRTRNQLCQELFNARKHQSEGLKKTLARSRISEKKEQVAEASQEPLSEAIKARQRLSAGDSSTAKDRLMAAAKDLGM